MVERMGTSAMSDEPRLCSTVHGNGRCKKKARPGYATCAQCAKRGRRNSKRHRHRRIDNGRCSKCGEPAENPFKNDCDRCRTNELKYRRKLARKRTNAGLCKCGGTRRTGRLTCERCGEKNRRRANNWYYKHAGLLAAQRRRIKQARQRKKEKRDRLSR